jgi:adenylate cyclase
MSARLLQRVMNEMGGIVEYHVPLTAGVSEVDVLTFEYELNVRRLLDAARDRGPAHQALRARQTVIAERLPRVLEETHALMGRAIADTRNDDADRLQLARVDGVLEQLGRQVPSFLALGAAMEAALAQGRLDEAARLAASFEKYELAFGADLSSVRESITSLTRGSLEETREQSASIRWINVGLFLAASIVGLGLVAALGYRLQQALQALLDGTRRVERGELTLELPVTSKDEIGELTTSFNRMIGELRSKERITDTFGKFVDPRVVATLLAGETDAHSAARREATIFFSDIKGFSALSENLTPDVMVRLLNGYFTAVTNVIRERQGIVDKYIGDAVMAFWTTPFSPGRTHAAQACLAALAQQEVLGSFRHELSNLTGLRRNLPEFKVRMGLATGETVVGTLGSETIKSYTVIGDTVNVASRLEGANKIYGTSILITEETFRLAQEEIEAREIDLLIAAGKTEPVRLYELMSAAGALTPVVMDMREIYGKGLAAYQHRDWDAAESHFLECLRLVPGDGPSTALLQRLPALRTAPLTGDWDGVWGVASAG